MSLVDATRSATDLGDCRRCWSSASSGNPARLLRAPLRGVSRQNRIGSRRRDPLSQTASRTAVRNSLLTAPVATAIATVLGVPLAYVLARETFPGKRLIEALVVLPLVVPPVVGGAMLLSVVGRFTPIGAAATRVGVPLTDSLLGVVLAQTFVAAPFVVITARAGFGAVDAPSNRRPDRSDTGR